MFIYPNEYLNRVEDINIEFLQRNKIKACAVFRAFPKNAHALVFIGYFSSPKCSSAFQMPSLSTSVVM